MRCKKLFSAIFLLSWLAVFLVAGSLEQYMIGFGQAIVYFAIIFAAIAVSGVLSGLLTIPKPQDEKAIKTTTCKEN